VNRRHSFLSLACVVARFLPVRVGYLLAECSADVIFVLSPSRRRTVSENLRHVLGDLEKRRLRREVRMVFKNTAKNYFDLIMLSQSRFKNLEGRTTIEGWHHLATAVASGKGTIIVTAHLGNIDFAGQVLAAHGIEMAVFIKPFESTPALRKIAELRQRNTCRLLPISKSSMRDGLQILRNGGTLAIFCDRDLQGNGLEVKFFGGETTLPAGAVSLALRSGSTIVPIFSVRESSNRFVIHIEPPLKLVTDQSVRENLERLIAVMERYIGKYPGQWMMLDPVWGNRMANATQQSLSIESAIVETLTHD